MEHNPELSHPKTPLQYLRLFFSGFAMGAADIVPGVSGGTMAFILGVYENLINGIKSFDLDAIRLGLSLKFRELFQHVPFTFLVALGLGIVAAIFTMSNLLHTLLEEQPTYLFAFFAGLIVASIVAIGIKVKWDVGPIVAFVVGAVVAFVIVGLNPLENAGHGPLVLFFSGMIAICAMILPGVSGSFILLILGQYEFILGAVRSLDILSIGAVAVGAVVGIVAFSRILSWLLKNLEMITIAVLVGFMTGSLRKIYAEAADGTVLIPTLNVSVFIIIAVVFVVGFLLVSLLDHFQSGTNPVFRMFWTPPWTRKEGEVIAEKAEVLE